MKNKGVMWGDAAEAIDTIIANKEFLKVSDAKKAEYRGNVEALAVTHKKYDDAREAHGLKRIVAT